MYTEFITIYVGLVFLIVLDVFILLQLRKLSNKLDNSVSYNEQSAYGTQNTYNAPNQYQANVNVQGQVVFCRNCATQYDASSPYCPVCGTPR